MKKILLFLFVLSIGQNALAQVLTRYDLSYDDQEKIMAITSLRPSNAETKRLPALDNDKLVEESNSLCPERFGKGIDVHYTLSDGVWTPCEGGRIWSMSFISDNAQSLNFIFEDFHLADNSELYITNKDRSMVYGPVTNESITEGSEFLTDVISGNYASVVIFEPNDVEGTTTLTIKRVIHGFRPPIPLSQTGSLTLRSGQDVACYPEWERHADGIAQIISSDGERNYSGFLLMSTDYSFKPYILSHYRCLDNNNDHALSDQEKAAATNLVFKFHSKYTTCGGSTIATIKSYNGATFRAFYNGSHNYWLLIEINNENIKSQNDITWLGWDKDQTIPSSGIGILHCGTYKVQKISFDFNSLIYESNTDCWYFEAPASSFYTGLLGYPLFNSGKKVVGLNLVNGKLASGSSPWIARFEKFGQMWTGGGTNDTRLSNWLDPTGTNQYSMNSCSPGDFQVVGNSIPCGEEIYSIMNLPAGFNVVWSFSDPNSSYASLLHQNTPSLNECTLSLLSGQKICETMVAKIYRSGSLYKTKNKFICNNKLFLGTYSQTGNGIYPNITATSFDSSTGFTINPNCDITINASAFNGQQFTVTGVTPLTWNFDSLQTITARFPSSYHIRTATIRGTNSYNCSFIEFPVYIDSSLPGPLFSVNQQNTELLVTINRESLSSEDRENNNPIQVVVTSSATGQIVYSLEKKLNTILINTSEWKSGIYVVTCKVGEKQYSQKVTIK